MTPAESPPKYAVGDLVWVSSMKQNGEILEEKSGGRYRVQVQAMQLVCPVAQLGPAQQSTRPKDTAGSARERGFTYEASTPVTTQELLSVDLHGLTVDEAIRRAEEHISRAVMAGLSEIEIVHGIGSGKVKAALHQLLGKIPMVRHFTEREFNRGTTRVFLS